MATIVSRESELSELTSHAPTIFPIKTDAFFSTTHVESKTLVSCIKIPIRGRFLSSQQDPVAPVAAAFPTGRSGHMITHKNVGDPKVIKKRKSLSVYCC